MNRVGCLALAFLVLPVTALADVTILHHPLEDSQYMTDLGAVYMERFGSGSDRSATWNRYPYQSNATDYIDYKEVYRTVQNVRDQDGTMAVLAHDGLLDWLFSSSQFQPAGSQQPFVDIPDVFKRFDDRDTKKVVWIGVGWIARNAIEVRGRDGCDPEQSWETCAEEWSDSQWVVKQKVGHKGWPIVGVGFGEGHEADGLADFMASADASEISRRYYIVVPHNTVRKRRVVTFELWETGGHKLVSKATIERLPVPAEGSSSKGERNVCGVQPRNACPAYDETPELLQLLESIGWQH